MYPATNGKNTRTAESSGCASILYGRGQGLLNGNMIAVSKRLLNVSSILIINLGNCMRPVNAGSGDVVGGATGGTVCVAIRQGDDIVPSGGGVRIGALQDDGDGDAY